MGFKTVNGLHVGIPLVVEFDLPSTILPPPASLPAQSHYCLLAILHHTNDQFNNVELNADALAVSDRKVAQRNLQIVNFTGTLPPPDAPAIPLEPMSALIDLFGGGRAADLVIDLRKLKGSLMLLLPKSIDLSKMGEAIRGGKLLQAGALDCLALRIEDPRLRSNQDLHSHSG